MMPSKTKSTTKSSKLIKKPDPLDDEIDTNVKVSGIDAKISSISLKVPKKPISNYSDTPKILEKQSPELSRMEKIKKNIENDQDNKAKEESTTKSTDNKTAVNENSDYNPEILSASDDIINIPNKSNLWAAILIIIIIILLAVIGVWYYQQYGNKNNQVKSETISRQSNQSTNNPLINIDNENSSLSIDSELNMKKEVGELNGDINDLGEQFYDNPPALDFVIPE